MKSPIHWIAHQEVLIPTRKFWPSPSPPAIVGYRQLQPDRIELRFDRELANVSIVRLSSVPDKIDPKDIPVRQAESISTNSGWLPINLFETEISDEYSLLVLAPNTKLDCDSPKFVEIVRQPANWLQDRFGYDRRLGYSILGRRSVVVRNGKIRQLPPLTFIGKPRLDLSVVSEPNLSPALKAHPELTDAAKIISFLWSSSIRSGPISLSYSDFLQRPFQDKLSLIHRGEFAIMCAGMRDLFLHASTSASGLRARAVEAYNYAPQFQDLVTYGHSTAEVWVEALGRWVLFDPWMGIALEGDDGQLLSAADLTEYDPERIRVLALVPSVERFYTTAAGSQTVATINPSLIQMRRYSMTSVGHVPGYLINFKNFIYRDHVVDH